MGKGASSIPEPAPQNKGLEITPALILYIDSLKLSNPELVKKLVRERHEFGLEKYGQPLMSEDGRNGIEDARQELGDLLQYLYKVSISNSHSSEAAVGIGNEEFRLLWETSKEIIDSLIN